MENLTQEVIFDILSRLPVTSVLQFKLVCKAWFSIAQNPLLPGFHFLQMGKYDPCLILHCDYPIQNQLYAYELSSLDEEKQTVHHIRVPTFPEFDVVGSGKGLLCLCDSSTKMDLYVYNPFTRDYTELPKSTEFQNRDVIFGFGFHPTTNEYKVVRIDYCRKTSQRYRYRGYGKSEVHIFTSGSQGWRSLGHVTYHMLERPSQVLINGRLHWTTWPRQYGPSRLLISFDLADEQFRVVQKPDCGDLERCSFELVNLGGYLSAARHCNSGNFAIWVMEEYDLKESWIKKFSIGIHVPRGFEEDMSQSFRDSKFYRKRPFFRFLYILKNGDILLEYKCRALVTYDPRNGTFKNLLVSGMPNWFRASVHEGSLCSSDSFN